MNFSLLKAPLSFASWKMKAIAAVVILGLFTGWTLGAIKYGKNEAYKEVAEEQAKEKAKELQAKVKEFNERKPVIEAGIKRQAATENRVAKGRKLLDEAITKAGDKPTCDLSDDELRAYEQILGNQKD